MIPAAVMAPIKTLRENMANPDPITYRTAPIARRNPGRKRHLACFSLESFAPQPQRPTSHALVAEDGRIVQDGIGFPKRG